MLTKVFASHGTVKIVFQFTSAINQTFPWLMLLNGQQHWVPYLSFTLNFSSASTLQCHASELELLALWVDPALMKGNRYIEKQTPTLYMITCMDPHKSLLFLPQHIEIDTLLHIWEKKRKEKKRTIIFPLYFLFHSLFLFGDQEALKKKKEN